MEQAHNISQKALRIEGKVKVINRFLNESRKSPEKVSSFRDAISECKCLEELTKLKSQIEKMMMEAA